MKFKVFIAETRTYEVDVYADNVEGAIARALDLHNGEASKMLGESYDPDGDIGESRVTRVVKLEANKSRESAR